jgi:signal transduction histidine kinase
MLAAVTVVTTLAWWDAQREASASLSDLETEQTVVASCLGASLRAHLAAVERDAVLIGERALREGALPYSPTVVRAADTPRAVFTDPSRVLLTVGLADGRRVDLGVLPRDLLEGGQRIERAGELTVFVAAPDEVPLYTTDGRRLSSPSLRDALDHPSVAVRLGRPEAAQLGLLERTAVAGLAHVDAGPLGRWGIATVATAARERDRDKRAQVRLVLGVLLTSGLVLAFGTTALRRQREELELKRELDLAEAQRAGDEKLARAERLATMGTFATGIAHEVSTPLGVIVGRSEQLLRGPGEERAARNAAIIIEQAERIQHVVRRFLDMARGGPPSLELADPSDVARAAAASVEHRLAKARVALVRDIPARMPSVRCDRALLEQAVVNLLLNACEACQPGGHVDLAARSDSEQVAFVVIDDGAGISAQDAARVTEPFFTTKTADGGTGVGLAIVTEIAKSHRGALSIGKNSPRGTRACIEIPIAEHGGAHAGLG